MSIVQIALTLAAITLGVLLTVVVISSQLSHLRTKATDRKDKPAEHEYDNLKKFWDSIAGALAALLVLCIAIATLSPKMPIL